MRGKCNKFMIIIGNEQLLSNVNGYECLEYIIQQGSTINRNMNE